MDCNEELEVRVMADSGVPLPCYSTSGSAGMDLRAHLPGGPVMLSPGGRALIPTGLRIALPAGYEAQVRPRSGLALKHGVTVLNSPGTIDADYRGEVGVVLVNHGDREFTVNHGDRVAQMVVSRYARVAWRPVAGLDDTVRGEGGFGHTGI